MNEVILLTRVHRTHFKNFQAGLSLSEFWKEKFLKSQISQKQVQTGLGCLRLNFWLQILKKQDPAKFGQKI